MTKKFNIVSNYKPAGDQPKAISEIVAGINAGLLNQTLLTAEFYINYHYIAHFYNEHLQNNYTYN